MHSSKYCSKSLKIQAFKNSLDELRACRLSLSTCSLGGKVYLFVNRPNALQFVQGQYQFYAQSPANWFDRGEGLLGWLQGCFLLLNKLKAVHGSSLLKDVKYL